MKLLVTGGSGFVGAHVLSVLRRYHSDLEVHCLQRRPPNVEDGVTAWHAGDILDVAKTREIVAQVRPDQLLHLAWDVTPPDYASSLVNLAWCSATHSLVEQFIRSGGKRLVAVGTCAEYEQRAGALSEAGTPLAPRSPYAHAKHVTNLGVRAFCDAFGVSYAWARIFFLFGPGEHPSRFFPSAALPLLEGHAARVDQPNLARDYLFVGDAAEALVAILRSNLQGPVNVGAGRSISLKDFAEGIASHLGPGLPLLFGVGAPPQIGDDFWADIGKVRDLTGWRPATSFADAIDATLTWWKGGRRRSGS
ncbi:MAG: NAD-dependent epimerase/dehydratase family protein [Deltaproteobacteria bacterium]